MRDSTPDPRRGFLAFSDGGRLAPDKETEMATPCCDRDHNRDGDCDVHPSADRVFPLWLKAARIRLIRNAEEAERQLGLLRNRNTSYADAIADIAKAHRKAAEVYTFIEREKIIPDGPVTFGDPSPAEVTT